LFPWLGRRFLHAENPERTILLNVRAILQLFRERGVHVEAFETTLHGGENDNEGMDEDILSAVARVEGWIPLPLTG
jgi:platelet-activating factor acetylhydrolase